MSANKALDPPLRISVMADRPRMTAKEYKGLRAGKRLSKYRNQTTVVDGIKFTSKREAQHYGELAILLAAKKINKLKIQPSFPIYVKGIVGEQEVCKVIADFSFIENGKTVVVDVKGYWTTVSRLKWKLAKACYPQFEWRIVK